MFFTTLPTKDLAGTIGRLDAELRKHVTDLRTNVRKRVRVAGMKALFAEGTGKVGSTRVSVGVIILRTPGGHVVLCLGLGEIGRYEKHREQVANILRSIRPKA